MQISLQDIRRLGYQKLLGTNVNDYIFEVEKANMNHYGAYSIAYGFPSKWGSVYESISDWYHGMVNFMYYCEPMIESLDLSGSSKDSAPVRRKFRNRWGSLWATFAKDMKLTQRETEILQDFGIRLAFVDKGSVPDGVVRFYNTVLNWSLVTQYESNLISMGLSQSSLLSDLILKDSKEFRDTVEKCWRC